jgi:hypothetical protein
MGFNSAFKGLIILSQPCGGTLVSSILHEAESFMTS